MLGVIALPDVNIPLLKVVAGKTLEDVRIKEDQAESGEISKKKLPEDQVIASRLLEEELSELP